MKHCVILFFFFTITLFSKEKSIRGVIVSSDNSKPLASATISVEGTETGTTSNQNGEFLLPKIPDGAVINISFLGYETQTFNADEIADAEILIKLEPKIISSQTVLVTGILGKKGLNPTAFSQIKRNEIEQNYTHQDIPEYLGSIPSTTFYSENGNGLGYNYLSIRGFDQRRISVAINGIPQNDPEDHNVYWLDFPDLLASTEMIQVQRGAGTGVIGYPSVGGSINIITSSLTTEPGSNISASYGSYNTRKYSAAFSSGLINNKYSIYAKLSKIMSSGYRDKSWINFNSYHVSAVRFDKDLTTQINIFGGPVADGLAYTGIAKFAVKDKKERRKNYSYWETDGNSYSYTLDRRSDEIENFSQPHFELLNEYNISKNVSLNSALFVVLGTGFFDYDGSWSIYYDDYFRLKANHIDSAAAPTNALIRAQVENKQWGWIPRISIKHNNGELITGAELRIHRSLHWGSINHAENIPVGVTKDYRYYEYKGAKDIFNFFVNESYSLNEKINLLAELQLAYHKYDIYEEKYLNNNFSVDGLFLNPRVGVNYKLNPLQSLYLSFARVSREPRLKNYYDAAESSGGEIPQFALAPGGRYNFDEPLVKPETMNDLELGTSHTGENLNVNLNLFYMLFNDEIVKNGLLDRFGQPKTGNVDRTIHTGIELSAKANLFDDFELILNGTYSRNYIDKGNTFVTYSDPLTDDDKIGVIDLSGNAISGFPEYILNGILRYKSNGLFASLNLRYSGKFYSDNYDNKLTSYLSSFTGFTDYTDNVIDAFFTANFFASYELSTSGYLNSIKIFAQVNNIFDNLYAAYAIGKEFFPAAERNFNAGVQVGF